MNKVSSKTKPVPILSEDGSTFTLDRVSYPAQGIDGISSEDLYGAGKGVSDAFPTWNIVVTCGPNRPTSAGFEINRATNTLEIDIDTRANGVYFVSALLIGEIRDMLIWMGLLDRDDDDDDNQELEEDQ